MNTMEGAGFASKWYFDFSDSIPEKPASKTKRVTEGLLMRKFTKNWFIRIPNDVGGTNLTTSSPLTTTPKATFNSSVSASTNLTCGQNEEVSNCLPCEQSCDSAVRNITTICINDLCFNDGPQFCDCSVAKGFARDFNGKCIPHSQCPIPGCPSGQEWSKGPCDGTCEVPQPNCTLFNCSFPGCACKPGYVRFYGQCIPQAMCPPRREDRCGGCPAGKTCSHHEGYFFHRDRKPQCQWYNPCGFEVEEIDTYGPDK
ncbi:hypothetical protein QR680_006347 [Steinernema hermaphroditum]|uniref:TIL domain-containing protein n=1 Tax=Steinernema hermaphroditum TaxID=289476 RepID=A0AA39HWJ7_9BILA|nr:hypothetical protein QR680_006347 [Steinernema hermaphroditum]